MCEKAKMKTFTLSVLTSWIVFSSSIFSAETSKGSILTPTDFAGIPNIMSVNNGEKSVQLSPDGRRILYVSQDCRAISKTALTLRDIDGSVEADLRGSDIWVVDVPSKANPQPKPKRLTDEGDNWSPLWSPDGKHIAFVSNRDGSPKLWLISAKSRKPRLISKKAVGVGFSLMKWSADSRLLMYHKLSGANPVFTSIGPKSPPSQDKLVTARVLVSDGKSIPLPTRPPNPAALIVDIESGKSIEKNMLWPMAMGGSKSDQSAWLIHQQYSQKSRSNSRILEQFQAPLETKKPWKPIKAFNFDQADSNGKKRKYNIQKRPPVTLSANSKEMIALSGGRLWKITLGSTDNPTVLRDGRQDPWTYASEIHLHNSGEAIIALSPKKLWFITLKNKSEKVSSIDIPANKAMQLSKDASRLITVGPDGLSFWKIEKDKLSLEYNAGKTKKVIEGLQVSPDGSSAVFVGEGPQAPRDVWAGGIGLPVKNLTKLNPHLTADKMGQVQHFQYSGPNGGKRNGIAVLPAGYVKGKKYPSVVLLYPTARYTANPNKFAFGDDFRVANPHLLAANGYVVIAADIYDGRSKQIPGLVALVNSAADAAVKNGWSDPKRIALYGHSDGGFMVNAVISKTQRYKAAVSVAGYANYTSRWCSLDDMGNAYGIFSLMTSWGAVLMGSPMKKTQKFIEHSPIFQMDKVRTPLLLMHGRMDQAVPYEQSDEIFVALRSLSQKVEYALYEGEGHSPTYWTMPHQLDASRRLLRFLKTHL